MPTHCDRTLLSGKTILFVAPSAYPLGGIATWLDYIVSGIESAGFDAVVGLVDGAHHQAAEYLLRHPFRNHVKIKNDTGTKEGRIRGLQKVLTNQQADLIVVVNIPDTYLAVERFDSKWQAKVKVVTTLHAIQPDILCDVRRYKHVIDGVVCANRLGRILAIEYAEMNHDRAYYAPYGVNLGPEHSRSEPSDILRIVYSGRFEQFQKRVKDIPKILNTLNLLNFDYEFVFVGAGEEEDYLRNVLKGAAFDEKIKFPGALSANELTKLYRGSDVLLVTSEWETGPIVAWEAMANGLALACSDYIGSGLERSLIDGENALLFPVGDVEKAAHCLVRLGSAQLFRKIASNGYRLVRERYSKRFSVEQWLNCFNGILEKTNERKREQVSRLEVAGRLDRWVGTSSAETIRSMLGRRYTHTEPGGEWPHTHSSSKDDAFWEYARKADQVIQTDRAVSIVH